MPRYWFKDDQVLGLWLGEECTCNVCLTSEELSEMHQDRFITEHDLNGDEIYFCDRGSKEITAG